MRWIKMSWQSKNTSFLSFAGYRQVCGRRHRGSQTGFREIHKTTSYHRRSFDEGKCMVVPLKNNFPKRIFWNIPKYSRILWTIPYHCYSTLFRSIPECLQNILKYSKIFKYSRKYFGIFLEYSEIIWKLLAVVIWHHYYMLIMKDLWSTS